MIDKEKRSERLNAIKKRYLMVSGEGVITPEDIAIFLDDEIDDYRKRIERYKKQNNDLTTRIDELWCEIGDLKEVIVRLSKCLMGLKND